MKIDVGDTVYLRDDLVVDEWYGGITWLSSMSTTVSGIVEYFGKGDNTFKVQGNRFWYSTEMIEKVVSRVSLIENQRELNRLEDELKLHRAQFREEIAELTKIRDELKAENERLRQEALELDEADLEDGVSVSWQNDFQVDMEELDDEYILMVADEKRIRSELVASEWTKPIKGVEILKVPRLRVSLK